MQMLQRLASASEGSNLLCCRQAAIQSTISMRSLASWQVAWNAPPHNVCNANSVAAERTLMSLQAGRQAALPSRARLRVTGMTPFQQRPTTGGAEVQLAHAVSGLQQPQAYFCKLTALQQAAAARGHVQPRAALLRAQNLQVRQDDNPWLPAISHNGRQSMPHHSPSASKECTEPPRL